MLRTPASKKHCARSSDERSTPAGVECPKAPNKTRLSLSLGVSQVTVSSKDCGRALGHSTPAGVDLSSEDLAQCFLDAGVRNIILKLGAQGFYIAGQDVETTHVASLQVVAVDTTAAGDAFNGGFAYALTHRGLDPLAAARFANAVAAISVTRPGAQSSMPLLADVEAILARG